MLINSLSALCGAGKSHRLIEKACELAKQGDIVLFIQPTTKLIDRTIEKELLVRPDAPPHVKFYRDISEKSVARQLTNHLNNPMDCGHIVFATHQVLPYVR